MSTAPANPTHSGGRTSIRVAVIGDAGTGKSSLIVASATETFPDNVPHLLPLTRLAPELFPDSVPVVIVDTSSRPENTATLIAEVQAADSIVLTYDCGRPSTIDRLSAYWLPELRRLEVKAPVLIVGCKIDLRAEPHSLEQAMMPIMHQFREIDTCIECSALAHIQVPEVFYYARKAALHPTAPLYDQETQSLKERCVNALKRVFVLCDIDKDGALNDEELNEFQMKCFNAPLQPSEILSVKKVVQENTHGGVNENGLTLIGFIHLHVLFIERGRFETTWTVLRKFGYDNELKIRDDLLPTSTLKHAPDQSVELTNEAVEFLSGIFDEFDKDKDGALKPDDIDDLFSTAPENPWNTAPYKDSAEKNVLGGLQRHGFLSKWALMTLLEPTASMANLMYIGYNGDLAEAFHITRRRRLDRKRRQSKRNVFQCFVFGPENAGKSTLLNALIGRAFSEKYTPTATEYFTANHVDLPGGTEKTLVMREVPEDQVGILLSNKEYLAVCDIAVFVHDSSDEVSWKKTKELLVQVANHGERHGYEVPCLVVSAKDDLDPYPLAIEESTKVIQDMGIENPISISMKLGHSNNVFQRIIDAAEHPFRSIPETEAGKNRKQSRRLVNRSLVFVSVGAAVTIVGLAAYKAYASRRSASS